MKARSARSSEGRAVRRRNRRPSYGRSLAQIHDSHFGAFARAASPGIRAALLRAGIRTGSIVELGCGSGIATAALCKAGYDVLGVEPSAAMLSIARRRAPGARFVRASLHDVTLPKCDAIVAVGEVFNYLPDAHTPHSISSVRAAHARLERFFRRAHRALRPGGILVFDALGPGRVPGSLSRTTTRRGRGWSIAATAIEDPARSLLVRRIEVRRAGRRFVETHGLLLLPAAELARMLRGAGFRVAIRKGYGVRSLPGPRRVLLARRLPVRSTLPV